MDGVLNVNKPPGWTSHDVVAKARSILKIKKIGHTGTLDPAATGVLVLCIGKATRIADYIAGQEKEYVATAVFGESTDTQDAEGNVIEVADASALAKEDLEAAMKSFCGAQKQVPPMVSAVRQNGKRLYELARKNITVERQPRDIFIKELELLEFRPGKRAEAEIRIVCSKGTYIRTLCSDIGDKLHVHGFMKQLTRTRVGRFELSNSIEMDSISPDKIISIKEALSHLPELALDGDEAKLAIRGGRIRKEVELQESGSVLLLGPDGGIVALAKVETEKGATILHPSVVFAIQENIGISSN